MARSRSGSDREFAEILAREWPTLMSVASRFRSGSVGSDDVVQEGVTRAYAAYRSGRVMDLPRYLTVTVRNVAIGLHRRQQSEARALERLSAGEQALASGGLAEHFADDDAAVREAFARLSPRCQEMLRLRVLETRSERDVAEQLGVALGTVKSGCHRCLTDLARLLGSSR